MGNFKGKPSSWLKRNSNGYPDFLFTILTYAIIILGVVSFFWILFGVMAVVTANASKEEMILKVMDSMKTGLISLAGVVFALAGSYTVRRFKKDEIHEVRMRRKKEEADQVQETIKYVQDMEDI